MTPEHNLDSHLIGTGEFCFAEDADTLAEAMIAGYRDFGNITAFSMTLDATKVEHKGSYRGKLIKDRTIVVEQGLSYILKCDEWTLENLKILFGGEEGVGFIQSAQTAAAYPADAWEFTADTPAKIDRWYDIKVLGARHQNLTTIYGLRRATGISVAADNATDVFTAASHGLANGQAVIFSGTFGSVTLPTGISPSVVYYVVNTATNTFQVSSEVGGAVTTFTTDGTAVFVYKALLEGTDFEADLQLGRIAFIDSAISLTPINYSVLPVFASPDIAADDDLKMFSLTPLQTLTRTGYGRLICYDQKKENEVVYDHQDFKCQVAVENVGEVGSQNWAEIQIRVTVDGEISGEVFVRESSSHDPLV